MKVAGIGFRRRASLASLLDVLSQVQQEQGAVDALATSAVKSCAANMQALARKLDIPVLIVSPVQLAAQITATQSLRQRALFGTGSLAEAAALAAAGPRARLLVCRKVSADGTATAAIADSGGTLS